AEGTDLSRAPWLLDDPLDDVGSVRRVVEEHPPAALGTEPAAAVVDDDGIAAGREPFRRLDVPRPVLAVRGAAEERRVLSPDWRCPFGGQRGVGGELRAVAGGTRHGVDDDVEAIGVLRQVRNGARVRSKCDRSEEWEERE